MSSRALVFITLLAAVVLAAVLLRPSRAVRPPARGETPASAGEQRRLAHASAPTTTERAQIPPATPAATRLPPSVEPAEVTLAASGRVTSASTGEPIAGARICRLLASRGQAGFEPESKAVLTDADGRYRIESRGISWAWSLLARAEGYAHVVVHPPGSEPSAAITADFALPAAGTISGRVVDEDKSPIAGARVGGAALMLAGSYYGSGVRTRPTTVYSSSETDGDGRFALEGLLAAGSYSLPVEADGFLPMASQPVSVGATDAEIVMAKGEARAHGRVSWEDGKPVRHAQVNATQQRENSRWFAARVNADANGEFRFTALHPGSVKFDAYDFGRDGSVSMRHAIATATLDRGADAEVNLVIRPRPRVRGRVIDADSGRGVPGVVLGGDRGVPAGGPETRMARALEAENLLAISDATGAFALELESQQDGECFLAVAPPPPWMLAKEDGARPFDSAGGISIRLPPPPEVLVKLRRAALLRGVVLQPDAATPAPGARVLLSLVTIEGQSIYDHARRAATTDAEGRFELAAIPGMTGILSADFQDATARVEGVRIPESAPMEDLRIVLQDCGAISGRVTADGDTPVGGAAVECSRMIYTAMLDHGVQETIDRVTTEADGSYGFSRVPPGAVVLSCTPPAGSELPAPAGLQFTLAPGERHEHADFSLLSGMSIDGVVSGPDNSFVEGASLTAQMESRPGDAFMQHPSATSDAQGYYRIAGIPPGRRVSFLTARHPDYESEHVRDLAPSGRPVNFFLKPAPRVTLRAVDALSGKPETSYRYVLSVDQSNDGSFLMVREGAVSDPEGAVALSGLGDYGQGRWRVVLTSQPAPSGQPTAPLSGVAVFTKPASGASLEVLVRLAAQRTIRGTVTDGPGGPPVPGAAVGTPSDIFSPDSRLRLLADAGGAFSVPADPGGSYTFEASKDGRRSARQSVEVPIDHDPEPITLVLTRGATLHVVATRPDGKPLEGATLQVRRSEPEKFVYEWGPTGKTAADGTATFDGLLAGDFTVELIEDSIPLHGDETIGRVEEGETHEVVFDFARLVHLGGTLTLDGKPPEATRRFSLWPDGQGETVDLAITPAGGYSAYLQPGAYHVVANSPSPSSFMGTYIEGIDVAPEPREQQRDLDIRCAGIDLTLVLPPGEQEVGTVGLSFEARLPSGLRSGMINAATATEIRTRISLVPAGSYQVSATGRDGLQGRSEWTEAPAGGTAAITVTMVRDEPRPYELAVTLPPGEYKYQFATKPYKSFPDPLNPRDEPNRPPGAVSSRFSIPGGATNPDGSRRDWPRIDDATGRVTFRWTGAPLAGEVWVRATPNNFQEDDAWKMSPAVVAGE